MVQDYTLYPKNIIKNWKKYIKKVVLIFFLWIPYEIFPSKKKLDKFYTKSLTNYTFL